MLCGDDQGRYRNLLEDLQNDSTRGNNDYTADTMDAYNLLVNYKTTQSKKDARLVENSEEVSFINVGGS